VKCDGIKPFCGTCRAYNVSTFPLLLPFPSLKFHSLLLGASLIVVLLTRRPPIVTGLLSRSLLYADSYFFSFSRYRTNNGDLNFGSHSFHLPSSHLDPLPSFDIISIHNRAISLNATPFSQPPQNPITTFTFPRLPAHLYLPTSTSPPTPKKKRRTNASGPPGQTTANPSLDNKSTPSDRG
jgi:hypothetical protein